MRIVDLRVERHTVPGQARNARSRWTERTSWRVRLTTAAGAVGEGEAAPLPEYSPDEPEAVQSFLRSWAGSTVVLEAEGRLVWPLVDRDAPPSAVFALEQAVLSAFAAEQGLTLREILGANPARAIPVQALLDDPITAGTRARLALRFGVRTFKLKVGGDRDLRNDLLGYSEAVREGARAEGVRAERIRWRLDANGVAPSGWAEVVRTHLDGVDWCEEPQRGASTGDSDVPWALDESLVDLDPRRWSMGTGSLAAFVLKPTLLGGLRRCLEWSRLARQLGLSVCVSHCFETGPGFEGVAALAAAVHRPGEVHGLFPHDFLTDPPRLEHGELQALPDPASRLADPGSTTEDL